MEKNEEEVKKPEVKEVKEENYKLVTVPTGEAIAIQTPTGDVITSEQAIVELLNINRRIKSGLVD